MLQDGRYAIRVGKGLLRVVSVQRAVRGALRGRVVLSYKTRDNRWQSFAFLEDGNEVRFFLRIQAQCTVAQLDSMRAMVRSVSEDPERARLDYEINRKENP